MNSMTEIQPLFGFLKRIFLEEMDKEMLLELQQIPVDSNGDDLDHGFNLVIQAVLDNSERMDDYVEELAVEFSRLFIGPKRAPAVPFASFYLSENSTVMSEITLEVRKQYLQAGLAVQNLYQTPEDHIGFELEFMEYLLTRLLELQEAGDEEEAERLEELMNTFFNDHLTAWAPDFADLIIEHSSEDFYRGAALILKETCRQN